MQVRSAVLLHDETMRVLLLHLGGRFRRLREPPFALVFFEGHRVISCQLPVGSCNEWALGLGLRLYDSGDAKGTCPRIAMPALARCGSVRPLWIAAAPAGLPGILCGTCGGRREGRTIAQSGAASSRADGRYLLLHGDRKSVV